MSFKTVVHKIVRQPWRSKKALWVLMPLELVGLLPMLILGSFAKSDAYRAEFWEIGFEMHENSNPNMILYAYANYTPLPHVPFVWSSTLTNFNVVISVLSLFMLLTRMVMIIMKVWFPLLSLFANIGLVGVYATSIGGQTGPDYADSRYPSPSPWYMRMSCSAAEPYGGQSAVSQCEMAKGTLAVTVYMLSIYLVSVGLSIWSMLPNKNQAKTEDEEEASPPGSPAVDKMEMQPVASGAVPFTPRTQAFHTLDRKLPLRYA